VGEGGTRVGHGPPQNKETNKLEEKKNVKFGSNFSHLIRPLASQNFFGPILNFLGYTH
jgi:hypothetical protein